MSDQGFFRVNRKCSQVRVVAIRGSCALGGRGFYKTIASVVLRHHGFGIRYYLDGHPAGWIIDEQSLWLPTVKRVGNLAAGTDGLDANQLPGADQIARVELWGFRVCTANQYERGGHQH